MTVFDLRDALGGAKKACQRCYDERDESVEMEFTETLAPGGVATVWRCPQCGREVLADAEMRGFDGERF